MTKLMSRLCLLAVMGSLCAVTGTSWADDSDDEKAREAYYVGDNHYAAGRYEEALEYFEKAYALSKRPQLLYNIANAYERMGDYQAAADYLRRYLRSPEADDVSSVRERIRRLEMNAEAKRKELQAAGEPEPKSNKPPADDQPTPRVDVVATTEDSSRASRKPAYLFLAGSGAALITATIFGLAAESAASDAEEVCTGGGLCPESAEDALNREKRFALVADISLVAGLASAGVGVYLLIKDSQQPGDKERRAVTVEPTLYRGGGGIGLSGRF